MDPIVRGPIRHVHDSPLRCQGEDLTNYPPEADLVRRRHLAEESDDAGELPVERLDIQLGSLH